MLWRPINFQGVVAVDKDLVDQLQQYLSNKELLVAQQVASCFQENIVYLEGGGDSPKLLSDLSSDLSMGEAVVAAKDALALVVRDQQHVVAPFDLKALSDQLNKALWNYVEVLEGAAAEFLQQLSHVRLDRLTEDTLQAVDSVKVLMLEKVQKCREIVIRLERHLSEYRDQSQQSDSWKAKILTIIPWKSAELDRQILAHLDKTKEALVSRDRQLKDSYQEFQRLRIKVQGSRQKVEGYSILSSLDSTVRERLLDVYTFLKMWKLNGKTRSVPEPDLVRILRMKAPTEQLMGDFQAYFSRLTEELFQLSRRLKTQGVVADRRTACKQAALLSKEVYSLGSTVGRFRDFLLRTNPNPYVRVRFGFSDQVTGTEPNETKELKKLRFSIESLGDLYHKIQESLERPISRELFRFTPLYHSIQDALHELGQPLASRGLMRKRGDALVDLMEDLDELGSSDPETVEYMGEVLSKAMRADWKYHTLHEVPGFRQLYQVHLGITDSGQSDEMFKDLLDQWSGFQETVKTWIGKDSIWRFPTEVEEAVEGLKVLLRDFLLSIDELAGSKDDDVAVKVLEKRRLLLKLRYQFGRFCLKNLQSHSEGGMLRNHFLFVDQYFEFMENKLNEIDVHPLHIM